MNARRRVILIVSALVGLVLAALPAGATTITHSRVVSANPADTTAHANDGAVKAIAQLGKVVYFGGTFTSVSPPNRATTVARSRFFAFDTSTGKILPLPVTVDGEVDVIVADPASGTLYLGGAFSTVDNVRSKGVVRIVAATGAIASGWKSPNINGVVNDLDLVDGRLLIGGNFSKTGTVARPPLLSLDRTTGAVTSFLSVPFGGALNGGALKVEKIAATPGAASSRRLVVIGNFSTVGGQRRVQMAMLNLGGTTAGVNGWATSRLEATCNTSFDAYVRDVDVAPDASYFVLVTTGGPVKGTLCDSATRWSLNQTANQQPVWADYTGGDTLLSVAITGPAVYVGGHQRWMNNPQGSNSAGPGSVPREGIAALSPSSGLPLSWNPGRTRGVGLGVFLVTPTGLWEGCDTTTLGGEYHGRLGFFPL